ncbi:MAG: large conductance mechanosensitive channel protein MscL [Lachnospiraceae bacterium]|nr:large conductance mechanosensitive channel protein MscL [Lachnospiraceae bacterium]
MAKEGGFFSEFKKFILRGNVMDMAIGVIIGAAFQNIVTALTGDFITPLIGAITGKTGEDGGVVVGGTFTVNGAVFNYGDFISAVLNFLIMAFILFCLIRAVNKLTTLGKKKEEAPAEPTEKDCPYCQSKISIKATRCPFCTSELPEVQ